MRDPNRIPELCFVLQRTWEAKPDMRLGQLIVNAVRPTRPCPELFAIEDELLGRRLQRLAGASEPPEPPPGDDLDLAWEPVAQLAPSTVQLDGAATAEFDFEDLFGQLLEVRFVGEYRHGSRGNPDATAMVEQLCPLLARVEPDVVVLDFSRLRYEWGNSLLRLYELIGRWDTVDPLGAVTLGGPESLAGLASLGVHPFAERYDALAEARRLAIRRCRAIG